MKLTKLQRYTAYCIMLEEAENPTDRQFVINGLCWMWERMFSTTELYSLGDIILPELYKIRNKKGFHDWDERKAALQQCIQETHPH